ncbi:hypothetical protein [Demequina lignilytica]|uniref:Uncharacterized protein n=1 Tax=Demequina lignilytica TaxID=3051663 RepID=A0AB35MHW3_9MICO|nr:hypothetical protein [Demequina sp. SYSU T0a273]MDN4483265.1 hypothetical protein [Demequina sp. SYSU T0a273]
MGFFTGDGDARRVNESEQWLADWLAAAPKSSAYLAQQVRKATGHTLQFTAAELRPVIDWAARDLRRDRSAVRPDWAYRSELGDSLTMHGAALIDGLLVYLGGLADQHAPQRWQLDQDPASSTYLDPTLGADGPALATLPEAVAGLGHGGTAWEEVEAVLRWFDSPGALSYASFDTPRDVRESLMDKGGMLRRAVRPAELPSVPASEALPARGESDAGMLVRDAGIGHAPGTPSDASHHALVMLGAREMDEVALLRFVRGADAAPGISRVAFRSHHLLEVWAPGLLCAEVLGELRRVARETLPAQETDGPLSEDDRRALLLRAPFLDRPEAAELAREEVEIGGWDATVTVQSPWLDDYTATVVLHPRIIETLTPERMGTIAEAIGELEGCDRVLWEDAEAIHVNAPGTDPVALARQVAGALG